MARSSDSSSPGVGAQTPDFTLRRTFDEEVTLSTLIADGPVVLLFYVFDFGHV